MELFKKAQFDDCSKQQIHMGEEDALIAEMFS